MRKFLLVMLATGLVTVVAGADSTMVRSPRTAARWSFLCPGGGQVYNRKYIKAGIFVAAEALALWKFAENRQAYADYASGDYELARHRYLEKRNKYAWWVAFIYFYGVIDAVVDAHLEPFDAVMQENLEINETPIKPDETP